MFNKNILNAKDLFSLRVEKNKTRLIIRLNDKLLYIPNKMVALECYNIIIEY